MSLADLMASDEKYDTIISRRSIEHWGLGRYGEALDPFGDRALMLAFARKLAPGGKLAIELPVSRDRLIFNATRIYGEHRLPVIMQGWRSAEGTAEAPERLGARIAVR